MQHQQQLHAKLSSVYVSASETNECTPTTITPYAAHDKAAGQGRQVEYDNLYLKPRCVHKKEGITYFKMLNLSYKNTKSRCFSSHYCHILIAHFEIHGHNFKHFKGTFRHTHL